MLELGQLKGIIERYRKTKSKSFTWESDKYYYSIDEEELGRILGEIQDLEMTSSEKIAKLEAKVFAYEQIISNSNFKAVVERKKE